MKSNPDDAAAILAPLWHIDRDIVEEAISHRGYSLRPVNNAGLIEQKKIAAAFFDQGLLPRPIDGSEAAIWRPE